jgi:ABC-2 type transport system ATP-binding protein
MSSVLVVEEVSKKIGSRTLVDQISFEVRRGEVFGLLGPNGAGKTTTIRMLVGLAKPTNGKITICGHDIEKEHRAAMNHVGAIVENPELYPYLSGLENLRQFARLNGGINEQKIKEIIQLVGLEERIGDKVRRYSLGMRQRLGLAQALLHDPALLILDEPTNGLDPSGMRDFRSLLRRLAERGTSVLISSHLLAEIEQVCDRVGVIQQGKWVTTESVSTLQRGAEQNVRLLLTVDSPTRALECLQKGTSNLSPRIEADGKVSLDMPTGSLNPQLLTLIEDDVEIKRMEEQSSSLEDVFLEITGGSQYA